MSVTVLSRTIVKVGLQALRLPLTVVERVTNNADTSSWPPAIAFETFEAETKKVFGSLIRDDELVREGTLQQAKVHELLEAERLQVQAAQTREAADARLEQRQESAEQARVRVARQAQQREQQLKGETAAKQRAVRQEAHQREDAAAATAQAREKAATAQKRQAAQTRISEQSAALAERSRALAATRKAQTVENRLQTKRAHRKP